MADPTPTLLTDVGHVLSAEPKVRPRPVGSTRFYRQCLTCEAALTQSTDTEAAS